MSWQMSWQTGSGQKSKDRWGASDPGNWSSSCYHPCLIPDSSSPPFPKLHVRNTLKSKEPWPSSFQLWNEACKKNCSLGSFGFLHLCYNRLYVFFLVLSDMHTDSTSDISGKESYIQTCLKKTKQKHRWVTASPTCLTDWANVLYPQGNKNVCQEYNWTVSTLSLGLHG